VEKRGQIYLLSFVGDLARATLFPFAQLPFFLDYQCFKIALVFISRGKDRLPVMSALDNMVGRAGSYAAGSTWHANFAIEAPLQSNPINKSVPFLPFLPLRTG